MTQPSSSEKISLTLHLSADVARRLQLAAEVKKRTAADVAAELLDRHLPHAPSGEQKGNIPYA